MKFSKRPRPMSLAGLEDEPQDAGSSTAESPETMALPMASRPGAQAAVAVQAEAVATASHPVETLTIRAAGRTAGGVAVWVIAVGVALLWALGPIAFAVGYRARVSPLQDDSFALIVFALLAIGPAFFVLAAAYMVRQGQKLGQEARRAQARADDLLSPTLAAAARGGDVTRAVREEIVRAGQAAADAQATLIALRDSLAFETDKLTSATLHSTRTAQDLAGALGRERTELGALAIVLDAQTDKVADAITNQARMVTEAVHIADTQMREAEGGLAARAAEMAAAASAAGDAARVASEDLSRQIVRLETAGTGVSEQVKAVEAGLSEQRAALSGLSQALRADGAHLGVETEAYSARFKDFIDQARASAVEMGDRAGAGGEALQLMMAEAAQQFGRLAESAKAEREGLGQSTLETLEAVSLVAAERRRELEAETRAAIDSLSAAANETRSVSARYAQTAREQVDQLSEAAFSAGKKAGEAFEARLEEARALVEQSSTLVEDAGVTTARKLELGAARARASMDELAEMLDELEARTARLPAAARDQADQVRAAVAEGIEELMAQARRTAVEAEAIDVGFQERVRRNFELLSEAVRFMGVATVAAPVAPLPARTKAPPTPRSVAAPETHAAARAAPAVDPPVVAAPAPETLTGVALGERVGLRGRIRLTPTATDREFSAAFGTASGSPPPRAPERDGEDADSGAESWTWKDLLASLDGPESGGEELEAVLSAELVRIGLDLDKLVPASSVGGIAAVVQSGDPEGARDLVRKTGATAARRIARRMFTDDELKRRTEVYLRRHRTLVDDTVAHDPSGTQIANLLATRGGRIYLLLDAAVGDMF